MDERLFTPRGDQPALLTLGCMNFGQRTPPAEALRVIDRALGEGVGLLDTANMYARGESERVVGRALRGRRGAARVASKVGLGRAGRRAEGLGRETVLRACEDSLGRLGIEQIDLYYLHAPDRETPLEETLGALLSLLEAGKIGRWGVSNYAAWQILELRLLAGRMGLPAPAVAQQLYNPLVRQLDIEYFRFAAGYPIHTTVYNPLAGGLLAGRHRFEEPPPLGSRFDDNRVYRGRYWSRPLFEAVEALRGIASEEGLDLVSLCYAFLLGHPGVDSVLVGPASVEHLDAALASRGVLLRPQARQRVLDVGYQLVGTDASYAR